MKRLFPLAGMLAALSISIDVHGHPTVEIVSDLLRQFDSSEAQDCLECDVRPTASAGAEHQAALFEHPKNTERPARVAYEIELPKIKGADLLLLAFEIGIADGAKLDAGADGVRFVVEVDGNSVFSKDWKQNRWQVQTVDLTPFAGRRIKLVLLTDAIHNANYDWALWGNPRILHFKGDSNSDGRHLGAAIGAVAVLMTNSVETTVHLKPIGNGGPVNWRIPGDGNSGETNRWLALDFAFEQADGVELSWEPAAAFDNGRIRLGAYPARPRLVRVSPVQAVARAGESVGVNVEVANEGRGRLTNGAAELRLRVGPEAASTPALAPLTVPALAPGETWRGQWKWTAPTQPVQLPLRVELSVPEILAIPQVQSNSIAVSAAPRNAVLGGDGFHVELFGLGTASSYGRLLSGEPRRTIGIWSPLMRVLIDSPVGPTEWNVPFGMPEVQPGPGHWTLRARQVSDPVGGVWDATIDLKKVTDRPLLRVRCELIPRQNASIRTFWGPNIYVGDGTTRDGKTWGLLPGLEYLYGPERSSNPRDFAPTLSDRRTPSPTKYTIPLMAVTTAPDDPLPLANPGRFYAPDSMKDSIASAVSDRQLTTGGRQSDVTLALWWDPLQKWDGLHTFPSPRFASPNFDEGMENHRIGIFIPSVPDFAAENSDRSEKPLQVRAGEKLGIECTLMMAPEAVLSSVREWVRDRGGVPAPNPWPRSFQEELDVCRAGFLKTIWDGKNEKWRHCIDWAPSHAPGFVALLWMDSRAAASPEAQQLSRSRVELAATNMLRDGGPASFMSQANCHIMQWEFPFLFGYLPEAMTGADDLTQHLIQTQRPDGGRVYEPAGKEQSELGHAGDSVLGTCANQAATILRYARITGDTNALGAGLKALEFMERFRVPRGGQTWECPMYEPDILAAAYAIKAYVDGWRATGDPRWLHDAVYWAETGVPFIYLWSLPDKPMMLGATIPVFGSTFYTHSWLAMPVQWCGLVYAYHVQHLAQELERTPLQESASPLPLTLNFSAADWRRITELITVSGIYQQFGDGPRIGAYPDSILQFEKKNPAFINPEDILINVLALKGYDPDVKTVRVKSDDGEIVISSGAQVENLRADHRVVTFQLRFFNGEPSHTLIVGLKPKAVLVNGKPLTESPQPVRRDPGWWWDSNRGRLYLTVSHADRPTVDVELSR